jgi:hypothetical protein
VHSEASEQIVPTIPKNSLQGHSLLSPLNVATQAVPFGHQVPEGVVDEGGGLAVHRLAHPLAEPVIHIARRDVARSCQRL